MVIYSNGIDLDAEAGLVGHGSSSAGRMRSQQSRRGLPRLQRVESGTELASLAPMGQGSGHQIANQSIENNIPLLRTAPPAPSLARRLTTMLRSPISGSNSLRFAGPTSRYAALSRTAGYSNITENDHHPDAVGVDLSSLTGMGWEMHETDEVPQDSFRTGAVTANTTATADLANQETAYAGAHPGSGTAPSQSFADAYNSSGPIWRARRRNIGDGLSRTLQLTRNSTVKRNRPESSDAAEDALSRSLTVRSIGQKVAEQENRIVAIREEAVDLSFFEGAQTAARRGTTEFAEMEAVRAANLGFNPDSYYFPPDPDIPDWKPFSMSTWYIVFLIVSAATLAVVQEYLCQWSIRAANRNSGILSFDKVSDISNDAFFAWKYMPTMVTIVFAVLFSIMDFDIRRLEPFYQLSRPLGSTAAASLNLDHLTTFQYFVPFRAMRLGQWAVALSTVGNIVASTVCPAIQNQSINFEENSNCTNGLCPDSENRYFVRIDPVWSRLLTGFYGLVTLILVWLFFSLRRKSGLLSDPKGIAGVASMAVKSHILNDFAGLDRATREQIHERLANRRFVLYQSSIWQGEWIRTRQPFVESRSRLESPHPPMLRLPAGVVFLSFMVFCLVMVPVISLTDANLIPRKVPWLPVLVATLLKLVWNTFEADVRLMEPFYILSEGHAKPEHSLTLDYQASVYGIMPFHAASNKHWLVAVVGLCSVLLDVLSVTVGSFNVNPHIFLERARQNGDGEATDESETSISFFASIALSVGILVFVIIVTVLVYVKRRHPFLPREPSTIAAILAFIYSSKMLDDFIGTERMTSKEVERKLKATGKTYGLGWFLGRDGDVHCAIDAEPMRSKYERNRRYIDATRVGPWEQHDTYE